MRVIAITWFIGIGASLGFAKWNDDPALSTPVCTEAHNQGAPQTVSDGAGGAYIVWNDRRTADGEPGPYSFSGIFVQHLNAVGVAQWATNGIPCTQELVPQLQFKLLASASGGVFVLHTVQRAGRFALCVQRIEANGSKPWGEIGKDVTSSFRLFGTLAMVPDASGGVIVTWSEQREQLNLWDIFAQRLNASGVAQWPTGGAAVCSAEDDQVEERATSDGAGGMIAAWLDFRGTTPAVFAQRIGPGGTAVWQVNGIRLLPEGVRAGDFQLLGDDAGGAFCTLDVIAPAAPSDYDVVGQRLSPSGQFLWGDAGTTLSIAAGSQAVGSTPLVPDEAGGFFAGWLEQPGALGRLSVQRVSGAGALLWGDAGTLIYDGAGEIDSFRLVPDSKGGVIAGWTQVVRSDSDINVDVFAQRVAANGHVEWKPNGLTVSTSPADQYVSSLAGDGHGGAIFAWEDYRTPDFQSDIYAEHIAPGGRKQPNLVGVPYSRPGRPTVYRSCSNKSQSPCELRGTLLVSNTGEAKAQQSTATLYLSTDSTMDPSDTALATAKVKPIKPGGSRKQGFKVALPADASIDGKHVLVVLDAGQTVIEESESDNVVDLGTIP